MDKFIELLNEYNKGKERGSAFDSDFYVKWFASAGSRIDRIDHVIFTTYTDLGMSREEAAQFLIREAEDLQD